MNRKDFLKSVALMAGATAMSPSSVSASIFQFTEQQLKDVIFI